MSDDPLEATRGDKWWNWAHTIECDAAGTFRPRSESDVIEIVRRAAKEGKRVRAAGSGHSWSPLVPTDGYLVRSDGLTAARVLSGRRSRRNGFCTGALGVDRFRDRDRSEDSAVVQRRGRRRNAADGRAHPPRRPRCHRGARHVREQSVRRAVLVSIYIAPIPDVYHYQHYTYPVTDVSFAIPIKDGDFSNVVKAWYAAVDGVLAQAKQGKYPVNVALHARFLKNSQALLSPAYEPAGSETHYCFIEILTFQPRYLAKYSRGVRQFEAFVNELAPQWMALGGRPHWAKAFQSVPGIFDYIRGAYGDNLTRWLEWRDGLDPKRMFWNAFMGKIFDG